MRYSIIFTALVLLQLALVECISVTAENVAGDRWRRTPALPGSSSSGCRFRASGNIGPENTTLGVTVDGSGNGIQSIEYNINGGAFQNANSIPVFNISTRVFRVGQNEIHLRVTHYPCGTVTLVLRFILNQQHTPPPPPPPPQLPCDVSQEGTNVLLTCSSSSSSITRIYYSINGVYNGTSYNGVLRFASSYLREGENDVYLTVYRSDGSSYQYIKTITKTAPSTPTPTLSTTQPPTLPPLTLPLLSNSYACGLNCSYEFVNGVFSFRCVARDSAVISAIDYTLNGGVLRTANGNSFTLQRSEFRNGKNQLNVTVELFCNGETRIIDRFFLIRVQLPTPSPTITSPSISSCGINCSYVFTNGVFSFQCAGGNDVTILTIDYSLNGGPSQTNPGNSFTIQESEFVADINHLNITIQYYCDRAIRSVNKYFLIRVEPPTTAQPTTFVSVFQVKVIGMSPENYINSLNFSYHVDESEEYLVIRITSLNSYRVIVLGHKFNDAAYANYIASDTLRIHKDDLREGNNTFEIQVYTAGGAPIVLTGTLQVTKNGVVTVTTPPTTIPSPTPTTPIPVCSPICNYTYEGNTVQVECYDSSDIRSIEYTLNQASRQTVQGAEFDIDGRLLTREQNSLRLVVNCRNDASSNEVTQLVQPLRLRCQYTSEDSGLRRSCSSNRASSTLTRRCYINDTPLSSCQMSDLLSYSSLTAGQQQTFKMTVVDQYGQSASSQHSFMYKFEICCRGTYNSIDDVISVSCDSNRPITSSQYRVNNGVARQVSLPFHVTVSDSMTSGSNVILLSVEARDSLGNRDTNSLSFTC